MTDRPEPRRDRRLDDDEIAAVRVLARRGRLLAIVIPTDVPFDYVAALQRSVNAWLDARRVPPMPNELEP